MAPATNCAGPAAGYTAEAAAVIAAPRSETNRGGAGSEKAKAAADN